MPEPLQEIQAVIRFRIKHSPDIDFHLNKLMTLNSHYLKEGDVVDEDGKLVIYI